VDCLLQDSRLNCPTVSINARKFGKRVLYEEVVKIIVLWVTAV
jgi:hypothetical protein